MPHLMQSLVSYCKVKGGNPQMIKQRFDWLLPDLLTAAKQEPDIDLIYVMVVAVHEVSHILNTCHVIIGPNSTCAGHQCSWRRCHVHGTNERSDGNAQGSFVSSPRAHLEARMYAPFYTNITHM